MKDLNNIIKEYHALVLALTSVARELRTEHGINIITTGRIREGKSIVHIDMGIEKMADALNVPLTTKESGITDYPIEKQVTVDDIVYFEICEKESQQ